MDSSTFDRFVREFPFLTKIFAQQLLRAETVGHIRVEKGDRELMKAKPHAWVHDAGGTYGEHLGHHWYWCVTVTNEVIALKNAWHRTIPYERNDYEDAQPIGMQLLGLTLNHDIRFIVETNEERWDWDEPSENVIIYKMNDFDWKWFFAGTNNVRRATKVL